MSRIRITLWSITEDATGSKSINYSVRYPDGSGMAGACVPLGGSIDVEVVHRDPSIKTRTHEPEPEGDEG